MDELEIGKQTFEYLLTNGVLGITTVLFLGLSAFIYRDREKERRQHGVDLEEIHKAHRIELASQSKFIYELMEKRIVEQRSALDAVGKATSTLDTALTIQSRRGAYDQAS